MADGDSVRRRLSFKQSLAPAQRRPASRDRRGPIRRGESPWSGSGCSALGNTRAGRFGGAPRGAEAARVRDSCVGTIAADLARLATIYATLGLVPLMLAVSIDLSIITSRVTKSVALSLALSGSLLAVFVGLWLVFAQEGESRDRDRPAAPRISDSSDAAPAESARPRAPPGRRIRPDCGGRGSTGARARHTATAHPDAAALARSA
ncbi:hypothetical protein [Nannocystis punicea]|uniref:Uncharacterized protein n=1 Tax=Nannocystis punicea TaxID=2995304 RepID=A0ABY7H7P5_9BACT|nr:hypothetical protein [Nannocystis poenicansa]WAS95110.1 hypothetical protein O0S08_03025 [Nannocystis poenicansa]